MKKIILLFFTMFSAFCFSQTTNVVVTKTSPQSTYLNGFHTTITYFVQVGNNSSSLAEDVLIEIPFVGSVNTSTIQWTASNGTSGTGNISQTTDIDSGEIVTYQITVGIPVGYVNGTSLISSVDITHPTLENELLYHISNYTYIPGTNMVYNITVQNQGPVNALNVQIEDVIPTIPGLDLSDVTWSGSNGTSGTGNLQNTIPTLTVNQTITYTVTIPIPLNFNGLLTNNVDVTTDTDLTNIICLQCTNNAVYRAPYADIQVTKTNNITHYELDSYVNYLITVTNNGPSDVENIEVTDPLPAGITEMTWIASDGSSGVGTLDHTIALLENGESITYDVQIYVPLDYDATQNLTNVVYVDSPLHDPTPVTSVEHTDLRPVTDIQVTKTSTSTNYVRGGYIDYVITVHNAGPNNAANIHVSDPLPFGINQMTWSGNNGTSGVGAINQTIPFLANGQSVVYTVQIYVPPTFVTQIGSIPQQLVNRVYVTSGTYDPTPIVPYVQHVLPPGPHHVTVSTNQYTLDELVRDVLVDMDCSLISNIRAQGFNQNTIGYFNANNSNFPIQEGIIIRSGNANDTQGPFTDNSTGTLGSGNNTYDGASTPAPYNINHLQQISNAIGQTSTVRDVSYIEFDFTPINDELNFNFLFASNEYGTHQCGYFDVFGFILTDLTTGTWTNLAVLPTDPTQIVSVGTIRNSAHNGGCASANPSFFGSYNVGNPNAPINMRGNTIRMTASSPVIPCRTYRIKLTIGDYSDTIFDSAVFIEAGSFDIGSIDLGNNHLISQGTAICTGETHTLSSNLTELTGADCDIDYQYTWIRNGEVIPGANQSTYEVTETGVYTLETNIVVNGVGVPVNCSLTPGTVIIEEYPELSVPESLTLEGCPGSGGGPFTFNLNDIISEIETLYLDNPADIGDYAYYFTEEQANDLSAYPINWIEITPGSGNYYDIEAYESLGETVYVRLTRAGSQCFEVRALHLVINCQEAEIDNIVLCDNDDNGSGSVNLINYGNEILTDYPNDSTISFHTTQTGAETSNTTDVINPSNPYTVFTGSTQTVYVRIENTDGTHELGSFTVTVNARPLVSDNISDYALCDDGSGSAEFDLTTKESDVLTSGTASITYYTSQSDAEGDTGAIPVADLPNYDSSGETIWVRAENAEGCFAVTSFELVVNPLPHVNTTIANYELCDDGSGSTTFDLTSINVSNDTPVTVSYHTTQNGAENDTDEITSPATSYVSSGETVWVRVVNANGCVSVTSFTLVVNPLPVVLSNISDYELCDDNGNGQETFDLTTKSSEILAPGEVATLSYHTTQNGAEDNTDVINPATAHNSSGGVVWVRAINANGCVSVTSFNLVVLPQGSITSPSDIEECRNNNTGSVVFDLTSVEADVVTNPTDDVVTYHTSLQNAQQGTAAISGANNYSTSSSQTIYIRVEYQDGTCPAISSVNLVVLPAPVVNTNIALYALCDEGSGSATFDLTTKEADVLVTGTATISYHNNLADAASGNAPIGLATDYPSSGETIWVRAENTNGCYSVTSFNLVVRAIPTANTPDPIYVCNDGTGNGIFDLTIRDNSITGGAAGTAVSYHESLADAESGDDPAISPYTGTNGQILYVRVISQFGCVNTTQTLQLFLSESPNIPILAPLTYCDPNSDGWGVFDLTLVESDIININPDPVTITYHETYDDAVHGANTISDSEKVGYANISQYNQTIYIRISPNGGGECSSIAEVQLIVHNLPVIAEPSDLEVCDDDYDGFAYFDLTDRADEVLNGLDISTHTVSYHENESDARANVDPILNPTNYPNTVIHQDSVWVRVNDLTTGCFDVVELIIIVNPLPLVDLPNVPAYHICDTNEDGFEEFNLENYKDVITQGQTGLTVTYHDTYADAFDGINSFEDNPAYDITAYENEAINIETIFVRVETEKGCFVVTLLDLVTDSLPVLTTPVNPVFACDADTDGFGYVDLDSVIDEMLNGAPASDYVITFHETYTDAEFGISPILETDNYQNIDAYNQIIYVRVETTSGSGCFNIYSINIVVTAAPVLPVEIDGTLPDLVICDENTDGFERFDLTEQTTYILSNTTTSDLSNIVIRYYETEQNAIDGVSAIVPVTNYLNLTNPQTIWAVMEDTVTGCSDMASFELIVNVPLDVPFPTAITLCDQGNNGVMIYDLTVRNSEILTNATHQDYTIEFYLTYQDALDGDAVALITDPENFSNAVFGHTPPLGAYSLGVRITDNTTGCQSYTILDIRRIPMPNVDENLALASLILCDDTPDASGADDFMEVFNLTVYETYIRQGDTSLIFSYHTSLEDAQDNVGAIADPTAHLSETATIYIRVANPDNRGVSCAVILPLELIVNPLPVVVDDSFEICETNSTGFASFYFPDFNEDLLGENQAVADFTISYHLTLTDAQNGTNILGDTYTNQTQFSQTIGVRIVNNATGCIRYAEVTLYAEEAAVANQPDDIIECDYDGVNDGITEVDLTQNQAVILGTQSPTQFIVTYHLTSDDAHSGENAIVNPETYTNTDSPNQQTIYVRVENSLTNAPCYDVISFELYVEILAEPFITTDDDLNTICINWNTGQADRPLTLYSNVTAPGYTFEWYRNGVLVPGANQSTLTLDALGQDGTYHVVAISQNGCVSENSDTFEVYISGTASHVSTVTTNAFQDNQDIIVTVEGHGEYMFQLDYGPIQSTGHFVNVSPGTHFVTVYDVSQGDVNNLNACDSLVIDDIELVNYPKFFTPNGDGYNDTWNITGLTDAHMAEIHIFDRYGKLLKQLNPQGEGWDGTFNGNPVPSTDYWFKVLYNEAQINTNPDNPSLSIQRKEFKAHFSLKR